MGLYWIQKRSSSANLRLRLSVFQQSQIHKICLVLSSSALPWFHTGRVRISVVWLISLHCLHQPPVIVGDQLQCLPLPWVAGHHGVMVGMDNLMAELGVFWDIHASPVHDQVSVSLPLI